MIGKQKERQALDIMASSNSKLVAAIGRRRIGNT